jgi:hypothetical protein
MTFLTLPLFWYLVGFSIHNPFPKICVVVPLWDTYAENLKFFVFMSLKIRMIKKEHILLLFITLFTAVDITIYQQFNLEHVQGCGCDLKLRFLSIDVF